MKRSRKYSTFFSALAFVIVSGYNGCSPLETVSSSSEIVSPDGGGGGSTIQNLGENYYKSTLTDEIFRSPGGTCIGCHGSPRELTVPISQSGPILYQSYLSMRTLLLDGSSATNNAFYNAVTNLNGNHPGGDQCAIFGPSGAPCREFIEWYELETNANSSIPGTLSQVNALGKVTGWAVDSGDLNRTVTVRFYEGGESGSGTFIGSAVANQFGSSGGYSGNHDFSFQLADGLRDGTLRDIYAYGVGSDGSEVELAGSPFTSASYIPSTASINDFNANVAPVFNSACINCHAFDFEESFSRLLTPTPAAGGTSTNNRLYVYATGGNGHAGGNACGGSCQILLNWYNITFQ